MQAGRLRAPLSVMKAFVVQHEQSGEWKAKPGYRILVIDRGAVRFDFPRSWMAGVDSKYVRIIDREPPDDRCGVMVSCRQISLRVMEVPMVELLREVTSEDMEERPTKSRGPIIGVYRPPLEAAWRQMRFIDRLQRREACTRVCLARGGRTLATIVFDFWPEDELNLHDPWTTLLQTLAVGEYLDDPTTGRRREKRG
jgi:hypothetical protein